MHRCTARRFLAQSATTKNYKIKVGILCKRPPMLLRTPTPFESAYAHYQSSSPLNHALQVPYNADFFVTERRFGSEKDSSADGGEGGLMGNEDAVVRGAVERETGSSVKDVKRLDRSMTRSLYLVLQSATDGQWHFPQGGLQGEEALHEVRCESMAYILREFFSLSHITFYPWIFRIGVNWCLEYDMCSQRCLSF
jgi:hypothetical protein